MASPRPLNGVNSDIGPRIDATGRRHHGPDARRRPPRRIVEELGVALGRLGLAAAEQGRDDVMDL